MNKAVLVIDMPEFCSLCMFCRRNKSGFYGFEEERCSFTQHLIHYDTKPENRECPLKPIPQKLEGNDSVYYQWGDYEDGWNHCIDVLIGD